ncbi:DMT family transporter [Saccharobesus litoralis]|uniref:DMT family transporter n=1 Tax=Saccharobesus litoralis TaxID=2172099 RepID=UPI0038B68224
MNVQPNHKVALLQTHLAVLLLAGTALFSKLIPMNATAISAGRAVIACLLLVLVVKLKGNKLRLLNHRDYAVGFLLGVLMASHWVTYFYAMQYSTVAVGMIALYTFPVLTVFLEPLLDKRMPALKDIVLAVFVFTGVLLMVPEFSLESQYTLGILLGVLSAVFFTLRNILNKYAFTHYSATKNMSIQALVIAILLMPWGYDAFHQISISTLLLFLLLGTAFTALPHVLIVSGLRTLQAKSMSLIACLSPVYGAILALLILHEMPNVQTVVGGLIVLSAAIMETLSLGRKQS